MEKKSKKIQKKPCMFNYSQKCIVSWTSVLNILGSVFNSESICVGFENVFLIKSLVNLMSNFNGFWSKSTLYSNATLKYFIFKLCATKLSTKWVFIRSFSPIFRGDIHFFDYFFWSAKFFPCISSSKIDPFLYHQKSIIQSHFSRPKINIFSRDKIRWINANEHYPMVLVLHISHSFMDIYNRKSALTKFIKK